MMKLKTKRSLSKALKPTEIASLLGRARKNNKASKAARKRLSFPFLKEVVRSAIPHAANKKQLIRLVEKGNRALLKAIDQFKGKSSDFTRYVKSEVQKAVKP